MPIDKSLSNLTPEELAQAKDFILTLLETEESRETDLVSV